MRKNASTVPIDDAGGATWRLPEGVSLLWQSWDEVCPGTIPDLTRYFTVGFELDEEILNERLEVVCRRFEELGLAEPDAG